MRLYFRKFGQGHPLIIIHGLYGSSDNWINIGRELSEYFEVFLLDQRNHGQSPHNAEHSYAAMKSDLLEFMDTQQIERAILLGHSMGGKTAMLFALQHPERVSRLVVADIAPKKYTLPKQESPKNFSHLTIFKAMREVDFETAHSRSEIEKQLARHIWSKRVRKFLLKNIRRNKTKCLGEAHCFGWQINVEALYNNLDEILGGVDASEYKGKAVENFPALFLKGEHSGYLSPDDLPQIKKMFAFATLETIPQAGHWLHAEQPEKFIKSVQEFIFD